MLINVSIYLSILPSGVNARGDAEGIKEQLQGIKGVSFLLDDNVGAIAKPVQDSGTRFKRKFMRK